MTTLPEALKQRFTDKFTVSSDSDCWKWVAATNGKRGYGKMLCNGKLRLAHHVAYEIYVGEIPKGLTIDHLCNNRLCVNPDHLKAVTQYENNMRGTSPTAENKRKEICVNGHPLTDENIIIQSRKDGVRRKCRPCQKIYTERAKHAKR